MSACDHAFERLTRGPFPGGPFPDGSPADPMEDARVERHLASCHECRRLAEALRPAVSLFHEALERTDDLPRYSGKLSEERQATPRVLLAEPPLPGDEKKGRRRREPVPSLVVAIEEARPRRSLLAQASDPQRLRDAALCLATVAASVAVALMLAQFAETPPPLERTVAAAVLSESDWSRFAGVVEIEQAESWSMPAVCAENSTRPANAQVGSAQVACCTLCHAAGGEDVASLHAVPARHAIAVRPALILSSCGSCHYGS